MTPWLFTPPRRVVAVTHTNGTRFTVQPGTWWEMAGAYGWDTWCTFTTTAGESLAMPRHLIKRIEYNDDSDEPHGFGPDGKDWGFS